MRNLKTEQIAAANYPYFKYSLEYALDSLERMGAARMEFYACYPHLHVDDAGLSQVRAVKRQLKDHHLTPICFTPEQCLYPVNIASRDVNARKRSLDVYVKSMEFAAEMDIELCQFLSGFGCLDEKDEDIWKRAVESVAYLGRIAQGYYHSSGDITQGIYGYRDCKGYHPYDRGSGMPCGKGNDRYGHVGICR